MHVQLPQSCPTLCNPMDCSLPGSVHVDSPGKNTGVGCHVLLQGIFLIQGSNSHLHWQTGSFHWATLITCQERDCYIHQGDP